MRKYFILAVSAAAILAAVAFVGAGYLDSRRAHRRTQDLHAAVHAMTLQQLAAAIVRCDAAPPPEQAPSAQRPAAGGRITGERPDAAYCEDVALELDNRPLEIVKVKPGAATMGPATPASIDRAGNPR